MTKRHNNVAKIVAQAVEANNRKNIVKSTTGQFIHWNQEIRLPDNILDPRHDPETLKDQTMRRKPDIWYYTVKREGQVGELKLNLVEITIPWGDVEIIPEKFDKNDKGEFMHKPFKINDVQKNWLTEARNRKIDKYRDIVREAKEWLNRNKDEIAIKYKVSKIEVESSFIIISNLGMVPKSTEVDLCRLLKNEEKDKLRYARMWLKRMVNQVIRGSFECYINAGKEVTDIEHVMEVNHNIANVDDSINLNLWALNEEMGYDSHVKERIDLKKLKDVMPEEKLKYFIELPNADEDIVVKKETVILLENNPPQEEYNISIIDEDTKEESNIISNPIRVKVDDSSMGVTDVEDLEPESEDDERILVGDGEPKTMQVYAKDLCIPHSNESGMITGGIRRRVIIPADSESTDEESGSMTDL
jgi:hypothetical protein